MMLVVVRDERRFPKRRYPNHISVIHLHVLPDCSYCAQLVADPLSLSLSPLLSFLLIPAHTSAKAMLLSPKQPTNKSNTAIIDTDYPPTPTTPTTPPQNISFQTIHGKRIDCRAP